MFKARLFTTALLLGGVLVAGCTSHAVKSTDYSGFLSDYSDLTSSKSPSGQEIMTWRSPDFKVSDYGDLVFQPPTYYPAPMPNERANEETLQKVLDYLRNQVGGALRYRLKEAQTPGSHKLIFRGAITGVSAADQGLKPYEVIPVAMLVAGAQSASGHRTQYAVLNLEGEFIDADTGKPVLKTVRKILGKTVSNNQQPVTFADFKEAVDNLAADIRTFK